jgi:predicted acylesterase/phospholipase RssA
MIERRHFLLALGACGFGPALLGADREADAAYEPLERALVLSGGGARGAYEAGIVGALAARAGVSDGEPLPPYEMVCGTSIGALNGWFVATGQYQKMRELWYGISREKLIRPKARYAALRDSQSGVLDRAVSAFSLIGLMRDERGLLESEPVYDWISRNLDPSIPLQVPLVWGVTNLAQQRPEYFYVRPQGGGEELPRKVVNSLHLLLGPHTVVREVSPDSLHAAIFASAAIPIAFDPVVMPGPDGRPTPYCDGGVATNSPVGIAHAVAKAADVVLLDPPFDVETDYHDAVEIAFGVYGTMQRKIIEVEMRNAYFQSVGKRAVESLSPSEVARATQGNALLATFMHSVTATELRYIRPAQTLPVGVVGFNDQVGIGKAYRLGWQDVGNPGFANYDWRTFQL